MSPALVSFLERLLRGEHLAVRGLKFKMDQSGKRLLSGKRNSVRWHDASTISICKLNKFANELAWNESGIQKQSKASTTHVRKVEL